MDVPITRFQEIYKNRALRFGATLESAALAQRQNEIKKHRRNSRHSIMMLKRKINAGTLTPIPSPAVKGRKPKQPPVVPQDNKTDYRREMLKKWQAEKQTLLAKQKNEKPVFKVHHVATTSQFNLETVYSQIKGKPIAKPTMKKRAGLQQPPLVASSTYPFKPPVNIKPINLHTGATPSKSNKLPKRKKFEVAMPTNRVTRSQKSVLLPQLEDIPLRGRKNKLKHTAAAVASSEVPVTNNHNTATIEKTEPVTPSNKCSSSTVYVSPFVTMSRGKENARKEFHRRSMRGGSGSEKSTSPKAAAVYFYKLLNNQTKRLRNLCHEWITYKDEEKPLDEACDMIDVAIGQTELLLTKKFQQFKGLVETCETGNSEMPVTCLDLHGFWDMVMIQVDNLDKRFDNLEKLRDNDWVEILPVSKPEQSKKSKKKVRKTKSTAAGTSLSLKAAIQEARRKKDAMTNDADMILCVGSANTSEIMKRRTSTRNNLRISTLNLEARRSIGSPGLTMMTVTQAAKSAEKLMPTTPITHKRASPKSILKSQKLKSEGRKSKVVLFNNAKLSPNENQENDSNSSNISFYSPISTPKRRSLRLAKSTPYITH